MHEESSSRRKVDDEVHEGIIPSYLLDREQTTRAKIISNSIKQKRKESIKQKRKEKAEKWEVPLPKVRPVAEDEMFRVIRLGKRMTKQWKRMITKVTFVGPSFTRKPPKLWIDVICFICCLTVLARKLTRYTAADTCHCNISHVSILGNRSLII